MKVAIAGAAPSAAPSPASSWRPTTSHCWSAIPTTSTSTRFPPRTGGSPTCELTLLESVKLEEFDVVIAATGDDKVNVVVSLLAKTEFAVPRVVARVNDPRNEWLFDENWGVDVAVSTPRMLASLVEEAVAVGDLVRLMEFRKGQANLVEITSPTTRRGAADRSNDSTCRATPRW